MRPLSLARLALLFASLFALAAPAWAGPKLTEKQAAEARRLIQQLGDGDYRVREEASNKLARMGSAVEPILREGFALPDPEIRSRCQSILPMARAYDLKKRLAVFLDGKKDRDFPEPECWEQFQELVGDSPTSRRLFADMHRLDNAFLRDLDSKPDSLSARMAEKCNELVRTQSWGDGTVDAGQVALPLFAGTQPRLQIEGLGLWPLSRALLILSSKRPGREMLKNNEAMRKLLIKYLADWSNEEQTRINLLLVANLELKEAIGFVKSIIKEYRAKSPYNSAVAISVLARLEAKASIDEILPFLSDQTPVNSIRVAENVFIDTQLRDVALLSLVLATGQQARDYDFPFLKKPGSQILSGPNYHVMCGYFGFVDEHDRAAAFAKWDEWYKKNKSTLAK
jgi:hypothetical protein